MKGADPVGDSGWLAPQSITTARNLAARAYVDPALLPLEQGLLRDSWQLLGAAHELSAPGEVRVREAAGVPLLLVHAGEAGLLALHNVCRHRGGPLALADASGVKRLRCRYHGWTYGLDGGFRAGPDWQELALDPCALALPRATLRVWQGLLFVAIGTAPEIDAWLAPVAERLAAGGHALDRLRLADVRTHEVACNWKVYVDNYLEGYHVPHLHPGLNQLLDYRRYETLLVGEAVLQASPLDPSASFYGGGEAQYWWLWPNTMLNVLPGRLQTNRVIPVDVGRCRVEFRTYLAEADDGHLARDLSLADQTQAEDAWICERVQQAYASGQWREGPIHPRHELGVFHFQERWRAAMRERI